VIDIYGDGTRGLINGKPSLARFHDPQGMAYDHENGLLYVADTKNHAVRVIDLGSRRVSSVAGTGSQGRDRRGGLPGLEQRLSSPWALALSPDKGTLYVAMAGTHQLWSVDLSTEDRTTRNIAGSGAENVFDGPARQAALAQPSGFAFSSDGSRLYFTDTEGSAVRALNIAEDTVETIIGRAVVDPFSDSSLFDFGDIDGTYPDARLQHAIGITLMPTPAGDRLLIADTYNDKLKIVDPDAKSVVSWAGVKRDEPGGPGALRLLEPAGVSYTSNTDGAGRLFVADTNHHRIVEVDPDTKAWREVVITGLEKIDRGGDSTWLIVDPTDRGRAVGAFAPGASVSLRFDPELPGGAKVNREIPAAVRLSTLDADGKATPFEQRTLALSTDRLPDVTFEPTEPGRYLVELAFAWCTEDESICVPADLAWEVELDADGAPGAPGRVRLSASVEPL
jgi:sugar lactone lactonase YvrE